MQVLEYFGVPSPHGSTADFKLRMKSLTFFVSKGSMQVLKFHCSSNIVLCYIACFCADLLLAGDEPMLPIISRQALLGGVFTFVF